ncbi:MAG: hypothetical protein LBB98_10865 [Treponema sp.]|jgi:hypothetical protein|nr:hypothetical protein [Treponema sp.]
MISEKKPSIYYDRGTIGSSEELDEYGVWVKSEPQDLSSANTDTWQTMEVEEDFSPEPDDDVPAGSLLVGDLPDFDETETSPWLTEISTDMTDLADFNITSADSSDSMDDFSFFDDDLASTAGDTPEEPVPADEDTSALEDGGLSGIPMEDFLLEPEMEEEIPGPAQKVLKETEGSGEISTQLLMKIAQELSSIKSELSSLKDELHQIKNTAVKPAEQSGSGGFFDEEEDEKIALTGDELDNILNTANFTEETGTDVQEDAFDAVPLSIPEMETETEDPEWAGSLSDFSEEPSETGADLSALPSESREVPPELKQLREEGVEPMTPAPEDTSFLENDPVISDLSSNLSDDSSFSSSFDFDGAVIDEPDLSGELKENPIEEPSLENLSLELDMEVPSGEDETVDLLSGDDGDKGGDIEEIELNLDDSDSSSGLTAGELSDDFSLDGDLLDAADISLDDLISSGDETPEAGEDTLDGDAYDQVIPEGFLIESEDGPAAEENLEPEALLENADYPFAFDAIMETEDALDENSISPELVIGEIEAEEIPAEEESSPLEVEFEEEIAEGETIGISLSSDVEEKISEELSSAVNEAVDVSAIPSGFKNELRSVLSYMDQLLESLPEEKIEEFAKSEHFNTYKKLFEELGLA